MGGVDASTTDLLERAPQTREVRGAPVTGLAPLAAIEVDEEHLVRPDSETWFSSTKVPLHDRFGNNTGLGISGGGQGGAIYLAGGTGNTYTLTGNVTNNGFGLFVGGSSTTLVNGLGLGAATLAVLTGTNALVSALRRFIRWCQERSVERPSRCATVSAPLSPRPSR